MKKIYFLILIFPLLSVAQNASQNFVKTKSYRVPTTLSISSPTLEQAGISINYLDGLGRMSQQILSKQSGTGNDIITHFEYDAMGRVARSYLPYASQQNTMAFSGSAAQETIAFYNSQKYDFTANPYSESFFESGASGSIYKKAAPGNQWLGTQDNSPDHTVKSKQETNGSTEVIYYAAQSHWDASSKLFFPSLSQGAVHYYRAGELYKTVTKNENWKAADHKNNTLEEFKDKQGRLILVRRFESGNSFDTFYIYDQYANLSFVIPPAVNTALPVSTAVLDGMCYQYRYDHRNRLAEKKLPGKNWEFMVYNKLDQLVLSGPVISPFMSDEKGWLFTKYDSFGRTCYTGYYNNGQAVDSNSRTAMQSAFDHTYLPISETRTASGASVGSEEVAYTNMALPTSGIRVLAYTYYDDYTYPDAPSIPSEIFGHAVASNVMGLPTGTWEKIVGNGAFSGNSSYVLYDAQKFRPIRSAQHFYNTSYTIVDSKFDFSGKVLETQTIHSYGGGSEILISDKFHYAPTQQLQLHTQQINDKEPEVIGFYEYDEMGVLISKRIGGADITGDTPLQKVDYKYNVRGWLTDINDRNSLAEQNYPNDLFAFHINYTEVESSISEVKGLFNGNISETFWKTSSDNVLRSYGYSYDALNRLNDAFYQKPNSLNPHTRSYNESVTYDKNGNITSLYRNGEMDSDLGYYSTIDDLDYAYDPVNKDRLLRVSDATNHPSGFRDGSNTDDDFRYDEFGNLYADSNKGISKITYNHLNLPVKITFGSESNKIEYLYGATGAKIAKKATVEDVETLTEYFGGFQYKNYVLSFFATPEGYVNYTPPTIGLELGAVGTQESFNYVYSYTDHLGNIRLSYGLDPATDRVKIIEENHYYPFGLKHANYNSDQYAYMRDESDRVALRPGHEGGPGVLNFNYKYNGKEFQDELGLNFYDYGARNYDPAIGRWMNIDPLAEVSRRFSPYAYALDNPVYFIDPDGMRAKAATADNDMQKATSAPEDSVHNDDWVMYKGKNGQQQITYDAEVKSLEQAKAKYGEVDNVFYGGVAHSLTENFEFKPDGEFSVNGYSMNVADGGYTTDGGSYINKNASGIEQTATSLQVLGDALSVIGLATFQPQIVGIGGGISKVGLGIEIVNDLATKGGNNETLTNAMVKVAIEIGFGKLGDIGVSATRTVAGKPAVDAGENIISESIIQGTTMTGGKLTETIIKETKKK